MELEASNVQALLIYPKASNTTKHGTPVTYSKWC